MKKALIVTLLVSAFAVGVAVSDFVQEGLNHVFGEDTFTTKKDLAEKIEALEAQSQAITKEMERRKQSLEQLTGDVNAKDYINLTKETLLAATPARDSEPGKIYLQPPVNEMMFKEVDDDSKEMNELRGSFNNTIGSIVDVAKEILKEKVGRLNNELMDVNTSLRQKNQTLNASLQELEAYKDELNRQKKYIADLETLKVDLEKAVGNLETKIEEGRLKVSFKGDILFPSGKHQLKKEGEKLLESALPVLKKGTEKYDIFIAGHTDNVPIKPEARNKYASNWELSTYRAISVVKYLTGKGMNPQVLTAAGYGEHKPVASNDSEEGKARNRRVELFLMPRIIKREEPQ